MLLSTREEDAGFVEFLGLLVVLLGLDLLSAGVELVLGLDALQLLLEGEHFPVLLVELVRQVCHVVSEPYSSRGLSL